MNGNKPGLDVPNSFTFLYSGPLHIDQNQIVKAMALGGGLSNSLISTASYNITNSVLPAATPVIRPEIVTFAGLVQVAISCLPTGSNIYFTTNGKLPRLKVPNSFTQLYSGHFSISNSATMGQFHLPQAFRNLQLRSPKEKGFVLKIKKLKLKWPICVNINLKSTNLKPFHSPTTTKAPQ
jgi:hypothetical protein